MRIKEHTITPTKQCYTAQQANAYHSMYNQAIPVSDQYPSVTDTSGPPATQHPVGDVEDIMQGIAEWGKNGMRVLPRRQGTSCRQAGCSQRLPKLCPMLGSLDLSRSQSIVGMVLSISTGPGTACLRPACLLLAHEFGNLTMLILGGTSTDSAFCDGRTLGRTLTPVLSQSNSQSHSCQYNILISVQVVQCLRILQGQASSCWPVAEISLNIV